MSIVRKQDKNSAAWKKIKFMIFDAPLVPGTFERRMEVCRAEIARTPDTVC